MNYRGFTIETDWTSKKGYLKYWEHQNDDGTKFATSQTSAFLDIDDIIIERQAKQIQKLKDALEMSTATLKGMRTALSEIIVFDAIDQQLKENEQALKYCES